MNQHRYNCSIRGHCEATYFAGDYDSLEDCEANCQGAENADLIYLILSYDWETVSQATLLDQQEILKRTFGVRVPEEKVRTIIYLLTDGDIPRLLTHLPEIEEYLFSQLTPFSSMLLDISMTIDLSIECWSDFEGRMRRLVEKIFATGEGDRLGQVIELVRRMMLHDRGDMRSNEKAMVELVRGYWPAVEDEFGQSYLH